MSNTESPNKELLRRMAEIKTQITLLQAEYQEHNAQIINEVLELNPKDKKVDVGNLGRFSVSMRKYWEYSPNIKEKTVELKQLKDNEEANGTATYTEKPNLKFITRKEK